MKTNTNIAVVALLSFLTAGVSAQTDSVRVQQNTTTTSTTQTQIDQTNPATPTVTQQQPAAPAPAPAATETKDDDVYVLRNGEFGIRYMPTFSSLKLRDAGGEAVEGELTMSHGWGIMGAINFNRHVGMQAEVNYHEMNQKYKDQGLDREVNVSYLNIPLLLSLNTDKASAVNVNFVVGPQFGFNIGAEVSGDNGGNADQVSATVGAKGSDVGAAYGAGVEFMINEAHTLRLDVGFRGYYGLVDMSSSESNNGGSSETYNVLLKASRKSYSGYLGLTFLF